MRRSPCLAKRHTSTPGGEDAWLLRRIGLGGEREVQVFAGTGMIGLEFQGFLELANRLAGAALAVKSDA